MGEEVLPRIAVVGAGGVGGFLGGLLARAGHEVALLARGDHLRTIRESGLHVKSSVGEFDARPRASDDPKEIGPCDLVLFTVKTYDTEAAAPVLPHLLKPSVGRVLTLQNGVESAGKLAAVVGSEAVLAGCAYMQSTRTAPGRIEQNGQFRVVFGEPGRKPGPIAQRIHGLFVAAGIPCELADDADLALWKKFAFITAVAGVCGVERMPLGEVVASGSARAMLADAMRETCAVAFARKIVMPSRFVEQGLEIAASFPRDSKPSLLHDLEAGRRLEIDALSGAIVRLGAEVGIPTPIHRLLYDCLKPWDDAARRK
jgi:2-dehydropantoate 2-reductase